MSSKMKGVKLMRVLLLLLLLSTTFIAEALEEPLQIKCEVEAEILSISDGKFYWNKGEFYPYFDIGILVTHVKPLESSNELLVCSPLKEKARTDIVRIWDWNSEGTAWIYENQKAMAPHDKVKLNLTHSYVGEGSWPTIVGAELIESNKE
jgi:hypothetical protein